MLASTTDSTGNYWGQFDQLQISYSISTGC